MIVFPNAKINLGLNVVEKRGDGFHNIETIFYPIPWKDALEILPFENFNYTSSGITIDATTDTNLCVKVYQKLKKEFNLPPVHIHLHKNIPVGAGLGGGSSDAAYTVHLLNSIFNLPLSEDQMEDIVRPLGSDCAFFIRNIPVYAHGKGDLFEHVPLGLKGKWIILIYPNLHVSTKEAYDGIIPAPSKTDLREIIKMPVSEWKNLLFNDFEKSIFIKYPTIAEIKAELYSRGALYASMSGSGSTVFGIFDTPIDYTVWSDKKYNIQTGLLD